MKPRTNSKSEGFAFSTSSNAPIKIYPGESQYVTVTFISTNVMPSSGLFEAVVDGGSDKKPELYFLDKEVKELYQLYY